MFDQWVLSGLFQSAINWRAQEEQSRLQEQAIREDMRRQFEAVGINQPGSTNPGRTIEGEFTVVEPGKALVVK